MDKQVIENGLKVIMKDLNKSKEIINVFEKEKEQLEDVIEEVTLTTYQLYGKVPEGYTRVGGVADNGDSEEEIQELFLLSGLGVERRLQDFIDLINETKGERDYLLFLLNKSVTSLRRILYSHSDLVPVQYSLNHARGCLKSINTDKQGFTSTYIDSITNLLSLAKREPVYYNVRFEDVEEEILSKLDSLTSGLKRDLTGNLDKEDEERLQVSITSLKETSRFLQAVLTK
ncbi:hypothetical protein P9X10_02940 [Bacillus cereus]|nr:hypothetical protein [Bacillus cereus]